jgi:predicted enzyme related to lactoylglutathione lyase
MKQQRHRFWSMRHVGLMVLAAGFGGGLCLRAEADQFDVPALSNPATGAHLVGKLIWLDLETTDLPGAKLFYHALFGWNYRDYHALGVDYTVAMAHGTPVAGLVRRQIVNDTERRSVWLPFFSVADVGATFELALKAHAQVRSEPENLPLRGRQARLTDPEGAVFALVTSSSGDPSDDPNPRPLGTWGSPALLARDPAGEAVFYQGLFRYAVLGTPTDAGFERIRLSAGTHERASVRPLPGGEALNPQWISFVRVFSNAESVRQAVTLGGRVLVPATRAMHGASTAILADPTGAAFGIVELPPEMVTLKKGGGTQP